MFRWGTGMTCRSSSSACPAVAVSVNRLLAGQEPPATASSGLGAIGEEWTDARLE